MTAKKENEIAARPPIVAVMGHIDHGKSTLLDYIRKTNVVENEAGGITQRISAYEVEHKDEKGNLRKITFLDTPGHAAFSKMRERGAEIADIAILIVSAEDGVKPQTVEAWKTISQSGIPCVVAINKVDKPGANVEKTKTELAENEIYLENYGGSIPFAEISAKTGTGVDNLLSLILILADMENLTGNRAEPASGYVLEVNLDSRRGILGTLVIKNGKLKKGMTVAAESSICSTRIIENFKGEMIEEATFSSPVRIVGFDKLPRAGAEFIAFEKKRDAEDFAEEWFEKEKNRLPPVRENAGEEERKIIPVVLKADVLGSIEAIEKEIGKIKAENVEFKLTWKGIGPVTESDIKTIASGEDALVIAFNVKTDRNAEELAENRGIKISPFNIIYKLSEWLAEEMEAKRPRVETMETVGQVKIIRIFSKTKERQVAGGKVISGKISVGSAVRILRRDFEIGRGKITNLEKNKTKVGSVVEGEEFGMMIESKIEAAPGDVIESFTLVQK